MKALIRKKTLNTICQTIGVTSSHISSKCKISPIKAAQILNPLDTVLPTFKQAKLISKCLHIPFAGLYMNYTDLPIQQIHKNKFKNYRKIQDAYRYDESVVNIAIYDLLQSRAFYLDTKSILGEKVRPFTINFSPEEDSYIAWAKEIRKILKINMQMQYSSSSSRKFYLYIRNAVENLDVLIQSFTDVNVEFVRGISIFDDLLPVIGININDHYPAKTFSIIHELVHILKRESSLCNEMITGISLYEEEIFCNAVAGELLVPENDLICLTQNPKFKCKYNLGKIAEIANKFSVSKEVIARRLLDCKIIEKDEYESCVNEIKEQFIIDKEKQREQVILDKANGVTRHFSIRQELLAIDKTSSVICKAIFIGYHEEYFSKQDVSRYLDISQKNVDKFLKEVSSWG